MFRVTKWATPVVALALLLSFNTAARAEDSKGTGGVSGKVVDAEGKAVSGVLVRLFTPFEKGQGAAGKPAKNAARGDKGAKHLAEDGAKPDKAAKPDKSAKGDRPKPVATATTDAEGKFTMKDVPAGEYTVVEMVRGQGNARQQVHIAGGETASVDLKLKKGNAAAAQGEKPAKKAKKDASAAE